MSDSEASISVYSSIVRHHNSHAIRKPNFSSQAIMKYIKTRFTSLLVPKEELQQYSKQQIFNPFRPLMDLNKRQWQFFIVGLLAWTWDSFDYFSVSMNVSAIAEDLNRDVSDITWGITLVLMLRTVGAVIFGFLGDKYV